MLLVDYKLYLYDYILQLCIWHIGGIQQFPTFLLIFLCPLNSMLRIFTYIALLPFSFGILKFPIDIYLFLGGR